MPSLNSVDLSVLHRSAYDQALVGIACSSLDGRVMDVNPRLCQLLGRPREELIGQPLHLSLHPSDVAPDAAGTARLLAGESESLFLEQRRLHADGTSVHTRLRRSLVRDERGAPAFILSIIGVKVTDDSVVVSQLEAQASQLEEQAVELQRQAFELEIANRELTGALAAAERARTIAEAAEAEEREAAEELRRSQRMLAAVVDESPVAIVTVDMQATITRWNGAAERMLGWSAREMIGRSFMEIVPAERQDRFIERWTAILNTHSFPAFTTWYHHKNGATVDATVSLAALHDPDDRAGGAVLNLIDITEHKRLESQFRQAQKMEAIGQLAGGVAHDFNNLLTAITSYSDLLLQDAPEGEERHDDLLEIKNAAARAGALTRQLLAFSRQQVIQPRVLSVNAVVTGIQKMLSRLVREDIAIRLDLDASIGMVEADAGQLEQVLTNLVVNARDAIEGNGTITISTTNAEICSGGPHQPDGATIEPGRYVVLSVSDTGVGMSPAMLGHIFEPFYTTKEIGHGTGLGLSTVYGIVKQALGYISCSSQPGVGTTFQIHLPRKDANAADVVAEVAPPASIRIATGHERILLVEDEELVRLVARRILTRAGYTVLEARDGREALALLAAQRDDVDLVVTDMVMPGMSGPELAEAMRANRPHLRVLFVSGYSRDAIEQKGRFSEDSAYLEKPFTPDTLTSKVRELLTRT